MSKTTTQFIPVNIAVLTVSDSRDVANDTSGDYLREAVIRAGHHVADHALVNDNRYCIRATVSGWIASHDIQVILINGGTGFYAKNSTPEALLPLFDRQIDGFGEVFRLLSWEEIRSSTLQSRALAGLANGTLIFAMPGSASACRLAWEQIICEQLDARHRPCNFISQLKRG
ncbi:molybdenum cofactor biosynthesis protein B [Enterobacteriaceae bacterium LUAb1]